MIRRSEIWLYALALVCALAAASARAAIPSAERQVLLNLYSSAGGSGWTYNAGWSNGSGGNGAAGTECGSSTTPSWFGVICDSAGGHVIGISLVQNGLAGTLPALSGLTQLQFFNVANNNLCGASSDTTCALGGAIPSLAGLSQLQAFSIDGDIFSGSIPSLAGLTQLQGFDAANNNLSGAIPSLTGLSALQGFNVSHNALTGSVPGLSGLSSLAVFDIDHNQLTGALPALTGLTQLQAFYAFSNQLSGALPSLAGLSALQFFNVSGNQLSGSIPALTGLAALQNFNVDGNQLSGVLPSLTGLGALNALDVGGNQLSGTLPVAPNPSRLQANASVLCGNAFTPVPDANWDAATGVTPWYKTCASGATTVNVDQYGLTGTWYNPLTSGQGVLVSVNPDYIAAGHGAFAAAWYTFDVTAAGGQRWYTLQGDAFSTGAGVTLAIYATTGGNLNATPKVAAVQVGTATISFADCADGTLIYAFNDGRAGSIPLKRLGTNYTCATAGDSGAAATPSYLLSGAWYNPATSGQGFLIDVDPGITTFFAGWYTFATNGAAIGGGASQRWYTLQDNAFAAGTTAKNGIAIYQASGGTFNVAGGVSTPQVGTANIAFQSCTQATISYTFTAGDSAGQSGSIPLVRLGSTPAGCSP